MGKIHLIKLAVIAGLGAAALYFPSTSLANGAQAGGNVVDKPAEAKFIKDKEEVEAVTDKEAQDKVKQEVAKVEKSLETFKNNTQALNNATNNMQQIANHCIYNGQKDSGCAQAMEQANHNIEASQTAERVAAERHEEAVKKAAETIDQTIGDLEKKKSELQGDNSSEAQYKIDQINKDIEHLSKFKEKVDKEKKEGSAAKAREVINTRGKQLTTANMNSNPAPRGGGSDVSGPSAAAPKGGPGGGNGGGGNGNAGNGGGGGPAGGGGGQQAGGGPAGGAGAGASSGSGSPQQQANSGQGNPSAGGGAPAGGGSGGGGGGPSQQGSGRSVASENPGATNPGPQNGANKQDSSTPYVKTEVDSSGGKSTPSSPGSGPKKSSSAEPSPYAAGFDGVKNYSNASFGGQLKATGASTGGFNSRGASVAGSGGARGGGGSYAGKKETGEPKGVLANFDDTSLTSVGEASLGLSSADTSGAIDSILSDLNMPSLEEMTSQEMAKLGDSIPGFDTLLAANGGELPENLAGANFTRENIERAIAENDQASLGYGVDIGTTLFLRVHTTHTRCQKKGCVSRHAGLSQ